MTTPEDKFEYTVEAMRRFFVEERQRAANSQDAKRYGWMDQNVGLLDALWARVAAGHKVEVAANRRACARIAFVRALRA